MAFLCVPFDEGWAYSDKLDLKAIYRRPRLHPITGVQLTTATGVLAWDLVGGLPVRRHQDWLRKGFEYVTLADLESLRNVAPYLRQAGLDPQSYIQSRRPLGPWDAALYLADVQASEAADAAEVAAQVKQFGAEAVQALRGRAKGRGAKR